MTTTVLFDSLNHELITIATILNSMGQITGLHDSVNFTGGMQMGFFINGRKMRLAVIKSIVGEYVEAKISLAHELAQKPTPTMLAISSDDWHYGGLLTDKRIHPDATYNTKLELEIMTDEEKDNSPNYYEEISVEANMIKHFKELKPAFQWLFEMANK